MSDLLVTYKGYNLLHYSLTYKEGGVYKIPKFMSV